MLASSGASWYTYPMSDVLYNAMRAAKQLLPEVTRNVYGLVDARYMDEAIVGSLLAQMPMTERELAPFVVPKLAAYLATLPQNEIAQDWLRLYAELDKKNITMGSIMAHIDTVSSHMRGGTIHNDEERESRTELFMSLMAACETKEDQLVRLMLGYGLTFVVRQQACLNVLSRPDVWHDLSPVYAQDMWYFETAFLAFRQLLHDVLAVDATTVVEVN
jgi:hypothetical protein